MTKKHNQFIQSKGANSSNFSNLIEMLKLGNNFHLIKGIINQTNDSDYYKFLKYCLYNSQYHELFIQLYNYNKRVYDFTDDDNTNLFMHACGKGNVQIIKTMISDYKNHINAKNHSGISAITFATIGGKLEIVQLLYSKGASLLESDSHQKNILVFAIIHKRLEIIEWLLDVIKTDESLHGLINKLTRNDDTPLLYAIHQKDYYVANLLIDNGADMLTPNLAELTPLSLILEDVKDELAFSIRYYISYIQEIFNEKALQSKPQILNDAKYYIAKKMLTKLGSENLNIKDEIINKKIINFVNHLSFDSLCEVKKPIKVSYSHDTKNTKEEEQNPNNVSKYVKSNSGPNTSNFDASWDDDRLMGKSPISDNSNESDEDIQIEKFISIQQNSFNSFFNKFRPKKKKQFDEKKKQFDENSKPTHDNILQQSLSQSCKLPDKIKAQGEHLDIEFYPEEGVFDMD